MPCRVGHWCAVFAKAVLHPGSFISSHHGPLFPLPLTLGDKTISQAAVTFVSRTYPNADDVASTATWLAKPRVSTVSNFARREIIDEESEATKTSRR